MLFVSRNCFLPNNHNLEMVGTIQTTVKDQGFEHVLPGCNNQRQIACSNPFLCELRYFKWNLCGSGRSVGIATDYGLDGPGSNLCGATDTLLHRIISCDEGSVIWTWTKTRMAAILRIVPTHIPEEWTLRPNFHHWPLQKQAAIIWIVAHPVAYRLQTQRRLSLTDYMDFLQGARWKEYHRTPKTPTVGRYLDEL